MTMHEEIKEILQKNRILPNHNAYYPLQDAILTVIDCPVTSFQEVRVIVGGLRNVSPDLIGKRMTQAISRAGLSGGAREFIWRVAEDMRIKYCS